MNTTLHLYHWESALGRALGRWRIGKGAGTNRKAQTNREDKGGVRIPLRYRVSATRIGVVPTFLNSDRAMCCTVNMPKMKEKKKRNKTKTRLLLFYVLSRIMPLVISKLKFFP
jgi:hypothetical protein